MKASLFIIKIILMLGCVCLMFAPLAGLLISFSKDREKKNSHKRFRLVAFSAVYFLAITLVLTFVKDLLLWIKTWGIVQWMANHISIPAQFDYAIAVFSVMLINFLIGLLYIILVPVVRAGLKKKNLAKPKGKDKEFSFAQRIERRILSYFHDERWFFASNILKCVNIALISLYAVLFFIYPIPALWQASWLPADMALKIFNAVYNYPVLTLIPLAEFNLFLCGVRLLKQECEEFDADTKVKAHKTDEDLKEIDTKCREEFKYNFEYAMGGITADEVSTDDHHEITRLIAAGVEKDRRHPKRASETYMQCLDVIVRNDMLSLQRDGGEQTNGILVNSSFYSEFSEYFLRFASVILARGDNIVFVCNDKMQIRHTEEYVRTALEQMYSLYHSESGKKEISFDHPIWKIKACSSDSSHGDRAEVNNCSILITDLNFLTDKYFQQNCEGFIHLIDTVVFVDTLTSVNNYSHQMSVFDVCMKTVRETNALKAKNCSEDATKENRINGKDPFSVRYVSNQIKYICFDDSRIPGWDRVLKNLLYVDFKSANAMKYNSKAAVVLYNFEARAGEDGKPVYVQTANTSENLSVLVNISDFAIGFGAKRVALQADRMIPCKDLAESIDANANNGLRIRKNKNLTINTPHYNADDYRVYVAFDDSDNLPMAVRRYAAMSSDRPMLVMLFSRQYMLRDYYVDNIDECWKLEQIGRIPFEQKSRSAAVQKILVKASAGGVSVNEIFDILQNADIDDYKKALENRDLNEVLRRILTDCGKSSNDLFSWNGYFECFSFTEYDAGGNFVCEDRVRLRNDGMLCELIPGAEPARIYFDGREIDLPIPRDRITQNYITGQNMLCEGEIYTVNSIDTVSGKLYVQHATGGRNNIPYQYVQDREYHIDFSDPHPENAHPTASYSWLQESDCKIRSATVSVTRRPMEVLTNGYFPIDPISLIKNAADARKYVSIKNDEYIELFKQTYRRYGQVSEPVCSADTIMSGGGINASQNEALVMSVKLIGDFGDNPDRITMLASVMIGELMNTMFPSAAGCIAVCPVLSGKFEDDEAQRILKRVPKLFAKDHTADPGAIELIIVEDSPTDLGVISVLMSSGDDVFNMLFGPVRKYLEWYQKKGEKSKYLYFGGDEEPKCFDFEGLSKIAAAIGNEDFKPELRNVEEVTQYDVCDFCGKRYLKGTEVDVLDDGRKMCRSCQSNIVGNDKKTLDTYLARAKSYLVNTYGIKLDDDSYNFCFESTVKIVKELAQNQKLIRRGADVPLKSYMNDASDELTVHVEYSIPSVNLAELLVRELTHVWQRKNLPNLTEEMAEGHIALVAVQYLRFINQHSLASARAAYYESTGNLSGSGYRELVRELLNNPQFGNNPFAYLLHVAGKKIEEEITPPEPKITESGDYGLSYTPQSPDRALDGNIQYFYYTRLSSHRQKLYDLFVAAIREHREYVPYDSYTGEDIRTVCYAVLYDHPELFWFNWWTVDNGAIKLLYGVSKEEAEDIQRRIDEVVPKYLEGIDDSMSAYDVAIRIHVKLIAAVDYDTIALERQQKRGGPKNDEIDYLRTICGVFLNGTAVCEGYARGVQYLLQKCGVECAEAAGYIRKETGERSGAHAWNIVKIDGDYYYIDSTWDDSSNTVQTVRNTDFGFDYFCITTGELSTTRYVDLCPTDVPNCDATRANYYYHNDLVLKTYDLEKLKEIARHAAKLRKKSFTFKCESTSLFNEILERFTDDDNDMHELGKAAAKVDKRIDGGYSYNYNKHIKTFTYKFNYKA